MILTEEEIREEVSVKPSIKRVLTDCKRSHFSGMSNKSLGASFQVTLHTAHDCSECVDEVFCLIIYISLKYLRKHFG